MRTLLIVLLIGICIHALAQGTPDLSGEWEGTVQVLGGYSKIIYTLKQTGVSIEGVAEIKWLNGKDSSKVELKGLLSDRDVFLRPVKFIYRSGPSCLARSDVTYEKENGREFLRGKWRGDIGLRTCPPGTNGKILVERLSTRPDEVIAERGKVSVSEEDVYGQELQKELQSRAYYALLIGIGDYKDKELVHLDNPVDDAMQLKKVLTSNYTFDDKNVIVLSNPTRAEIIDAFDGLASRVSDRDQLLIFYAGHGVWDAKLNQGYWLPSDASSKSKSQWLSNSTIRDYIGGINSRHTLLITDACFSGGIFKERGATFENSRAVVELYKMPSRKAMTSGTLTTVPDRSVFVKYLIKNLSENDVPMISAGEIFQKFKIAVINNSQNGQVPQYGPIGQVGDEGGEFIFLRR